MERTNANRKFRASKNGADSPLRIPLNDRHHLQSFSAPSSPLLNQQQQQQQQQPSKGFLAAISNRHKVMKACDNKILVTVSVMGTTGPLRFLVDVISTAEHVVEVALRTYATHGRLPILGIDKKLFKLYCDNGEFEAMNPLQCIGDVGHRHFILHKENAVVQSQEDDEDSSSWKCWGTMVCSN